MAWAVSDGCRKRLSPGCPAMRALDQCALAMMRPGNCSLTCSARSSTQCFRRSKRAWRQPDQGLWEVRSGPQHRILRGSEGVAHFVHSKVMAWVAFDRAAKGVAEGAYDESEQRWRESADEIHAQVCERGFDRELNSFVQAYGSKRLDAGLLLIPLVGFLPASDPRVQGTLRALED